MTSWELRQALKHVDLWNGIVITHFGKLHVIKSIDYYQENFVIYFVINRYGEIEYYNDEHFSDITDDDIEAVKKWIKGRKWEDKNERQI